MRVVDVMRISDEKKRKRAVYGEALSVKMKATSGREEERKRGRER